MDFGIKAFLVYILLINLVSVIICIADKKKAKKGKRRISEKTLFLLCFAGGSIAMYLTMKTIRHKTKHKRFMIGIPIIIILQLALFIFLLKG